MADCVIMNAKLVRNQLQETGPMPIMLDFAQDLVYECGTTYEVNRASFLVPAVYELGQVIR